MQTRCLCLELQTFQRHSKVAPLDAQVQVRFLKQVKSHVVRATRRNERSKGERAAEEKEAQ